MGNLAAIVTDLLPRIVCPGCKAVLTAVSNAPAPVSLRCTGCGNNYPVLDGIPILLMDRATKGPPSGD